MNKNVIIVAGAVLASMATAVLAVKNKPQKLGPCSFDLEDRAEELQGKNEQRPD